MDVVDALHRRTSVRAFTDEPVTREQVAGLLDAARWSPSGGNLQPWHVHVVAGEARRAVSDLALAALMDGSAEAEAEEFPIYPPGLHEPYRTRRHQLGEQMYELLGIPREDTGARLARLQENYRFFGAPVGLFVTIDRAMGHGQWAHLGMFMQSFALAATAAGLATCMQEAWAAVRGNVAEHLGVPDDHVLYCGVALGHPDADAAVNSLRSERAEVDEFTRFHGF